MCTRTRQVELLKSDGAIAVAKMTEVKAPCRKVMVKIHFPLNVPLDLGKSKTGESLFGRLPGPMGFHVNVLIVTLRCT